ncbi:MAG TPA: SRPBCC family protein [Lacunisphaera sp.]|nr:SRPBCC family protein [Lacunisphaera sp.]
MKSNDEPGRFTAPGEVRLSRTLPGPIERVWHYVTDPEKRARWFAGGLLELRPGGRAEFAMRQAELAPDETPPDKYKHMHHSGVTITGRVLRCEPPHVLVFTFGGDDSEVTIELQTQGSQVLLVLTHRARGEDVPDLGNFATGWHSHLSLLVAELEGAPRPAFWPKHAELLAMYQKLRALTPSP